MKSIARFALREAKRANGICPWFLFQSKIPEKVKKLREK